MRLFTLPGCGLCGLALTLIVLPAILTAADPRPQPIQPAAYLNRSGDEGVVCNCPDCRRKRLDIFNRDNFRLFPNRCRPYCPACFRSVMHPPMARYYAPTRTYQRYWPEAWQGGEATRSPALPMVYQPTDTTQLGYYGMAVPQWQFRGGVLPPPAYPNWPLGAHCNGPGCYGCMNGDCEVVESTSNGNGAAEPEARRPRLFR